MDAHKKLGEPFDKDDINLENVKKETTPPSSEVATNGHVEKPPIHSTPCTDEYDLNEETITPTFLVDTKGNAGNLLLSSTPCMDIHKKLGEPFEKDDKNPSPTNEENLEKETTPPSSEVAASGDVENSPLNSTPCTENYNLNEKPITPSLKVTVRGLMERLLLFFTKLLWFFTNDTHQNLKKETTPLSPEVAESAGVEKLPSTLCTNEDDLREKTITPSFEAATKGDVEENDMPTKEKMKNETARPSSEVAASRDVEISLLNSTPCANKDDVTEETISPSFKVTVRGLMKRVLLFFTKLLSFFNLDKDTHQKQGKSFEKDNKNPLPTKNENVKKKTTPSSSKVVASDDEEEPLLFTSPCTKEEDLKEDIITPSSKAAARVYMQKLLLLFTKPLVFSTLRSDIHQNQGDLFEKDLLNPLPTNEDVKKDIASPSSEVTASVDEEITTLLFPSACTDEEDLIEETIKPLSKVAAKGYIEIFFLIFTELSLIFNLRKTHQKQGKLFERDYKNPLPTNKENVDGETMPPPSETADSGDVKNPPLLSSPCVDENVLKEESNTPSSKVAAKGFVEKLVLLFTKLLMFRNMFNRINLEGESLKKDHTSSLPTNEENVNEENTQPSSKVAISGDAHQKQAESFDKNHSNILPRDEDNLKDRTIATPSKVTARGYMEKLLLYFTPRMDTNQKQEESFQKDYTGSLCTDGHRENKHRDFISRVIRKFIGILAGINNGVVTQTQKTWRSFQELGATSIAYYCSPILLFQDTYRFPPTEFKTVMKVTLMSVAAATVLYMLCFYFSYAEFRDLAPPNILYGFGLYNLFCLLDIAIISIVFLLVGTYQVYYQPLFGFIDKHAARIFPNNDFITKERDIPLPSGFKPFELNLFRLLWRTIFMITTTVILMLIPFFKDVVDIVGAFGFWPLTVYYPMDMYIIQKKIPEWSSRWIFLQILSVVCLIIGTAAAAGSFAAIITDLKVCTPF